MKIIALSKGGEALPPTARGKVLSPPDSPRVQEQALSFSYHFLLPQGHTKEALQMTSK